VIARPLPYLGDPDDGPRVRAGTRAGRNAVDRRRAKTLRIRYENLVRTLVAGGAITLCVFAYLGLMANVTRMNYQLVHDANDRKVLLDETTRLDDRIARLETRERLAQIAGGLHMHSAQTFAEIALPADVPPPSTHRLALLDWLR
jgi:type II secretory pathway component PulM